MELAVEQGKVRSIGLSNFNVEQTKTVLGMCKVRPVVNQFEIHPLLQNNELVEYCQSENIAVTSFASLGAADRAWASSGDPLPLQNPVILRWLIQRNIIIIPKSSTPSRVIENASLFDFELSDEDMNVFKTQFPKEFRFYVFDM